MPNQRLNRSFQRIAGHGETLQCPKNWVESWICGPATLRMCPRCFRCPSLTSHCKRRGHPKNPANCLTETEYSFLCSQPAANCGVFDTNIVGRSVHCLLALTPPYRWQMRAPHQQRNAPGARRQAGQVFSAWGHKPGKSMFCHAIRVRPYPRRPAATGPAPRPGLILRPTTRLRASPPRPAGPDGWPKPWRWRISADPASRHVRHACQKTAPSPHSH